MSIPIPKYKRGDLIIRNNIDLHNSYVYSYNKPNESILSIRNVSISINHFTYSFNEIYNFCYDAQIIDKQYDIYDINYIRKEKIKKLTKNLAN